ncbi:unnamed protein product [Lampetra fluviatilis]
MFCPGKKRVPGSFPLDRVLKSHDPAFVEFVIFCLRAEPALPPFSSLAQASEWKLKVLEEEETLVEELVVEEMVVEEKEKTRVEDQVVVMQEKRKPAGLARMGRVIRSLLRRALLCGGRSTAQ